MKHSNEMLSNTSCCSSISAKEVMTFIFSVIFLGPPGLDGWVLLGCSVVRRWLCGLHRDEVPFPTWDQESRFII